MLDCSPRMMQALIEEYTKMIKETDMELQALLFAHRDISSANKYKEKDGELKDFLEKLNHRLITSKDKKFLRNQTAFFNEEGILNGCSPTTLEE